MNPNLTKGFGDELDKIGGIASALFKEPATVMSHPELARLGGQLPSSRRGKPGRPMDQMTTSKHREDGVAYNLPTNTGWVRGDQDGEGVAPSAGLRS
jgi:hypothetical protein